MLVCQVSGHHDKMARTKTNTQSNTKACRTPRRNRHSEEKKTYGLCSSVKKITNGKNGISRTLSVGVFIYSQTCVKQPNKGSTKSGCSKAGGCLTEVNISKKLTFGNILFGC